MFIRFQENPLGKSVVDCSVRAISNVLEMSWEQTYIELCLQGFIMADMPSLNSVIDAYLRSKGFRKSIIPNTCPDCYTVADFADDHQQGVYLRGSHPVDLFEENSPLRTRVYAQPYFRTDYTFLLILKVVFCTISALTEKNINVIACNTDGFYLSSSFPRDYNDCNQLEKNRQARG